MPEWGTWDTVGIEFDLSSNSLPTQTNKFRLTARLPDYKLSNMELQKEFEVTLNNPCNTANKVVFTDSEQEEVEPIIIMAEWSNAEVDLTKMFTDQFSKEGGLGSCGELTFELKDNTVNGVEYTVIFLNEEKNKLIVETDDPSDEGSYTVTLVVSLPQYPDA